MQIIIKTSENDIELGHDKAEAVIKGLRLLLLVGNDHETWIAANLLDILLPKP